jgi:hypothetical protein
LINKFSFYTHRSPATKKAGLFSTVRDLTFLESLLNEVPAHTSYINHIHFRAIRLLAYSSDPDRKSFS